MLLFGWKELAEFFFVEVLVEDLEEESELEDSDETSNFSYCNCQVLWVPVKYTVFLG